MKKWQWVGLGALAVFVVLPRLGINLVAPLSLGGSVMPGTETGADSSGRTARGGRGITAA